MYRIEKTFKFPMGHRLSKHQGVCFNFHGHSYIVKIGLKAKKLNDNDMIIDFTDLKNILKPYFDNLDHATMVNYNDRNIWEKLEDIKCKVIKIHSDPTAERMAELVYFYLTDVLTELQTISKNSALLIDYVTVFESDGSAATYSED